MQNKLERQILPDWLHNEKRRFTIITVYCKETDFASQEQGGEILSYSHQDSDFASQNKEDYEMRINGFSGTNTQTGTMGMTQGNDSVSKNIQNQIANAQQKLQDLSSNEELSLEDKMKKASGDTTGNYTISINS